MAKTSEETKDKIRAAVRSGKLSAKQIADKFGVSVQTVYNICKAPIESEQQEEESESDQKAEQSKESTDEYDWKAWAEFWKDRYLIAHAKLLELGHE